MNIVKRIAIGMAFMLLGAVSLIATIVPGGAPGPGRHTDETTTTTTVPPTTATTTGAAPVETAPAMAQPISTTTTRPATAPVRQHRPVVSTTTSPLRTAGEHPCPSGDWAPDC